MTMETTAAKNKKTPAMASFDDHILIGGEWKLS
jgi:hypothetical protein